LHPAVRLAAWLLALLAIQRLAGEVLLIALALTLLAGPAILARAQRLIRRTRWLLLSLFVVFAWGIAGDPLWSGFFAPSREGIDEAATQIGRLLLVLVTVGAFLETMPLGTLLSGSRRLLQPLRGVGIDADRGVIRLMLALRYAEALPRPRDWRSLLAAPTTTLAETVETVELDDAPLGALDLALLVACAAGFVALVLV
jgi:energy-coupling factor transporter transmembrane protein EcfT